MKLKRKTKKRLTYIFAVTMSAVMALPIFEPFLPRDNQPDLAAQYIKDMAEMADDKEPVSDLNQNLEGYYKVLQVVDGNSVVIQWGDEKRDLHLIGVDTPDENLSYEGKEIDVGKIAAERLDELLAGQTVGVEFDTERENEDGELLGYLYLEEVTQVNELMISEGRAKVAEENINVKYLDNLNSAQKDAKENETGFWADIWK